MERYSEYKDSGEQWLGEIPSHWEVKRLGNYFSERKMKVSDKDFQPLSVTKNGVLPQLENVAKSNDSDNRKLVCKGDFVINSRSDRKGSSGVSPLDGSVSLINIVLQPRTNIYAPFCNYLLKSSAFVEEYYRNGRGIVADLWTTRYDEMKSIKLSMPPLSEQSAIVSYLDRVTSQLDEAIAQQQRMIDLLNERKQIIIQHAVTKGLDPNAEMVESGVEWIGMMPKGWKCMPLKRCCSLIRTKASNNQVNRISLENIVSWKGSFAKTDSIYEGNGILYKKGDILFGKLRPYLAKVLLAESEGEALGDFWVMRPNDFVLPNYVKFIFLCYSLIELIDSTTYGAKMPRADWNANSKTLIPIPPIAVQHKICEYIDQMIDYTNSVISKNEHRISLLRERKQIIINEVVTGKVRVS